MCPPEYQVSANSEMEWDGISVPTVTAPSCTSNSRGGSSCCSPSLALSSANWAGVGFCGEPIAFHTV